MNFISYLLRHTKIHLYDSVHWYVCGQAHLSMPKVISNIKSSVCQDLSYDAVFFCIWVGIHRNSKLIQVFEAVWQSESWVLDPKFYLPIILFDYFSWNISRMALSFDLISCSTGQHHDVSQLKMFWSLMRFGDSLWVLLEVKLIVIQILKRSKIYLSINLKK